MDFSEIRRLTIIGLFSDDRLFEQLVLKGGNAISLVYGFGGRASLDVDFSIENDFADLQDIERRILAALLRKFKERGLVLFDGALIKKPHVPRRGAPRWGGYQFAFKLIEERKYGRFEGTPELMRRNALLVGPGQKRIFTVDFSKFEHCAGKVEKELDDYTIYVYSPEMIVIEKLRAICQQMPAYKLNSTPTARARDFYDIHLVLTASGMIITAPENLALLRVIFAAKEVPVALLRDLAAQNELHRLDWPAVIDTVSGEIHEFEFYFEFVQGVVSRLCEALRIE